MSDAPNEEFSSFDEQMMQLAAGASGVFLVYKSYVDVGFTEPQALELTRHIMELGMRDNTATKLEQMRINASVKAGQPLITRFLNI